MRKLGTFAISAEIIKKYKQKSAYHDAKDLLNSIVYPILFEKYGAEAQAIEGITAEELWKRNLAFNVGSEPTTYIYAVVCFDYKVNDISIHPTQVYVMF